MAVCSKEVYDTVIKHRQCNELFHPWASGCTVGCTVFLLSSIVGSGKYALILQAIPLIYNWKTLSKEKFKRNFIDFLRMTAYGASSCFLFGLCGCVIRKIFGRFEYHMLVLVPGFVSSISLFFIAPSKRYTVITAYMNSFLETLFLLMDYYNICKKSMRKQMLLFMVSNAGILYLLRLWKKNKPNKLFPGLWFYFPPAVERNTDPDGKDSTSNEKSKRNCPHVGPCTTDILKDSWVYLLCGFALGLLRSVIPNFHKPGLFRKYIFVRQNLSIALFAATYVALAKGTNCLLCRIRGTDHESYALAAGFLSGLSYYFQPSLTLSVAALSYCITIAWSYHDVNELLFNGFPVQVIVFMISNAILFHTKIFFPEQCSKFYHNLVSRASNGRADEMYRSFLTLIDQHLKTLAKN